MVTAEKYCFPPAPEEQKKTKERIRLKIRINYSRFLLFVAGSFFVLTLVMLSYLGHYAVIVKNNYTIGKLTELKARLLHEEELVDIEIAKNASYLRIARLAEDELGMGEPQKVQFLLADSKEERVIYTAKDIKINENKSKIKHKNGLMANIRAMILGF